MRAVIMRDVAAAEFFYGFPAVDEPSPVEISAWEDGVLTRAAIQPRLSLELVRRLGAERDVFAREYFTAVGWSQRALPERSLPAFCELLVPARVEPEAPRSAGELLRPFVTLPAGIPAKQLGGLVEKTNVLPATLWQLPISEFLFNFRFLAGIRDDD